MARSDPVLKTSRFIVLASTCVIVAALYFAQDVLIPIALAVLLSFLLTPLAARLERLGLHRIFSVLIVVLLLFAVVGGLGWVVARQVNDLAGQLPQYKDNIITKLTALRGPGGGAIEKAAEALGDVGEAMDLPANTTQPTTAAAVAVEEESNATIFSADGFTEAMSRALRGDPILVKIQPESPSTIESLRDTITPLLGPLGTAGLVLVFVIFMLLEREDLRDRLIRLVGSGQMNVTTHALDDAAGRISRYLVAQSIVNGTYGVAVAFGLWLIGKTLGEGSFPNFILWGLLCAVLRFVPYIGPWIAAAFPIAVSFAVFKGSGVFIATSAMFIVIELFSNNLMEPWLYGTSTGMSTMAIITAAVFWTWLWGPIGLVLATPLSVCLVVIGKHVPPLSFLDVLLGDEPAFAPPARVYQRLLALDQEEASDLVQEYLQEQSLEQVYEEVLLPALAMAEQDRHRGRLDETHQEFIRQSMKDLIEELGDEQSAKDEKAAAAEIVLKAKEKASPDLPGAPPALPQTSPALPQNCTISLVCLPAHDVADEIVGLMLAQLLTRRGYCAYPISETKLAGEMIAAVEEHKADVVVVSALPPAAVTHARYLCKRLHARFSEVKMVVGLWTIKGDLKKAKERIACIGTVQVVTTLAGAMEQIQQLIQPLLLNQKNSEQTNIGNVGGG